MAYTPLGLKDGEKVYASHVTHVEDGIADCESQITEVKDSLSELDVISQRGTSIASNSDLNDYADVGKYYSSGADVSGTLENCPTAAKGSGFSLYVFLQGGAAILYRLQVLVRTGNTQNPMIYYREYISSWGSWYAITASSVS